MGSFDKQSTASSAKAKQTKQIVMAAGLGVCLLVVVGFQVMKTTPRPASAGTDAHNTPTETFSVPTESVSDAMSQLIKDPTESLLRSNKTAPDPTLETLPRDPFKMSNKWIASLKRPDQIIEVTPPEHIIEAPVSNPNSYVPILRANTDGLKLQGIMREGTSYTAILNGSIVKAGSVLNGTRILKVLEDRILVQHADSPRGPTSEIALKRLK